MYKQALQLVPGQAVQSPELGQSPDEYYFFAGQDHECGRQKRLDNLGPRQLRASLRLEW